MKLLGRSPHQFKKALFDIHMNIFVFIAIGKRPVRHLLFDAGEPLLDPSFLFMGKKADFQKHRCMGP